MFEETTGISGADVARLWNFTLGMLSGESKVDFELDVPTIVLLRDQMLVDGVAERVVSENS